MKITDSDKSPITLSSGVKTANASERTLAVRIVGNDLANSIKGGNGADTLAGGKGSDTLTGGSGKDVFYYEYGDGNDVITDYTYRDKIKIKGSYSTLSSGDDVVIKVGSGRITVKNAIDEDLNISRASSFEERWFMENEESGNVALGNDELDSILDSKVDIAIDYKFNTETPPKVFAKSIPLTHNKK